MNGPVPAACLLAIPEGPAATRITLQAMAGFIRRFSNQPDIVNQADSIVRTIPNSAWILQINALFVWVQRNIRYVEDDELASSVLGFPVQDMETVQTPLQMLSSMVGDCDDQVTLLGALLRAAGFRTLKLVAVGFQKNEFSHVFLQVQLPDQSRWISLDPITDHPAGWQPPNIAETMVEWINGR